MMGLRSRIIGTGSALPETRLTNADLERLVDTSDAWIRERTGIRERRILDKDHVTSDLATEAGLRACEAAGVKPEQLDCIIVGTVTPDMPFPACATSVQAKMAARPGVAAFDLSAACAGFVYGMGVADGFIGRGGFKRVLVIGVEVLSRIMDWTDRNTCVLFGDGAGAVVMAPEPDMNRGILCTHLYADGQYTDLLCTPGGGTRMPLSPELLAEKKHLVSMNGREVYRHAVKNIAAACKEVLDQVDLTPAQIDWVVAHQANIRILEAVSSRVGIPMEKFFMNLEKYGNTSSASVPIALDEAVRLGKIRKDHNVLMSAFGGGFAWGAALIRW
jgi:3-oxoacyl-[acyl-carrier-protein] synthase-3